MVKDWYGVGRGVSESLHMVLLWSLYAPFILSICFSNDDFLSVVVFPCQAVLADPVGAKDSIAANLWRRLYILLT